MKDEIKEILDKFDKVLENYELDKKWGQISVDSICHLFPSEIMVIKDCLTNLQEENERLKEKYDNKSHKINYKYFTTLYSKATKDIVIDDLVYKCEDLDNLRQSYEKLYVEKEDYKSRNEKAIEYIELWHYRNDYRVNSFTTGCKKDLLNILQGVGKDE